MRLFSFFSVVFLITLASANSQTLSIVSGNGQIVQEQSLTTAPMVVQARDAAGRPAVGVNIGWSITQGSGTIVRPSTITDSTGMASANFLGTSLQPGASFLPATITATSSVASVNFIVTTSAVRQAGGLQAAPPRADLVTGLNITGRAGSTLPGAVVVLVTAQSGLDTGKPVPNVAVQIVNDPDPTVPSAMCNAPGGVVLTDLHGLATCDLVLGPQTGTAFLSANAGGLQNTQRFTLQVTPGAACSFVLSSTNQTFPASGGMGTVSVTTSTGCGWTAVTNASWITVNFGASGSTNANVGFTVAPNTTPAARSGTILIAGQTFTVNQSGTPGGIPGGPLTITTASNLPPATVSINYVTALAATGGQPPYTWSGNGTLPPGFSLNGSTGVLSGIASAVGNFTLSATVTDSLGVSQTQAFSLVVLSSSSSLTVTSSGFPSGVIGQAYQQPLTSSGGCVTPFSQVPLFLLVGGALPPGVTLQRFGDTGFGLAGTPTVAGTSNFSVAVQDACGSKATANFSLTILATAGSAMVVTPASLAFTVQVGNGNRPADQTLSITTNGAALPYSAAIATTTGGNWLALTNPNGTTPGTLTVSAVNYAQLALGTYTGTISITSGASNSPVLVPVTLTILGPPILMVSPTTVAFAQGGLGANVTQQAIQINSGTTSAHFTATANTVSGGAWLFLSTNAGDTPATLLASVNSAGLSPGTYLGSIVIAVPGAGSQAVAVTLTVPALGTLSVSPASLSFSAPAGASAVSPQGVMVSSSAGATSFTATVFTASGGTWLAALPQIGVTPTTVSIVVSPAALPAGSYSGTVTFTPNDLTIMPVSVNVALTVGPAGPALRTVTNAASFAPGAIAPGEIVTLFGSGLGPQVLAVGRLDNNGRLTTVNAGTQVLFDGIPAPILYTSDTQVSVIVPYDIFGRDTVVVQVANAAVLTNSINLHVADSAPAIFTLNDQAQGAILNQDHSINFPQTGAEPGSYVSLFATGEGQTDPPGINGKIVTADSLSRPRLPVTVKVAGLPAEVTYAGGAPGLAAGLLQVNVHLPDNLPRQTQVPVVLTVGGQSSPVVFLSVN